MRPFFLAIQTEGAVAFNFPIAFKFHKKITVPAILGIDVKIMSKRCQNDMKTIPPVGVSIYFFFRYAPI